MIERKGTKRSRSGGGRRRRRRIRRASPSPGSGLMNVWRRVAAER